MVNAFHYLDLFPDRIQLGVNLHTVTILSPDVLLIFSEGQLTKSFYGIIILTFRVILLIKGLSYVFAQLYFAETPTCK